MDAREVATWPIGHQPSSWPATDRRGWPFGPRSAIAPPPRRRGSARPID